MYTIIYNTKNRPIPAAVLATPPTVLAIPIASCRTLPTPANPPGLAPRAPSKKSKGSRPYYITSSHSDPLLII